jgi:hypothetical protein
VTADLILIQRAPVRVKSAERAPVRKILDPCLLLVEHVGPAPGACVGIAVYQASRAELIDEAVLAKPIVDVVVPDVAARQACVQRGDQGMITHSVEMRTHLRQVGAAEYRVRGQRPVVGEGEDDVCEFINFGHFYYDRSGRFRIRGTAHDGLDRPR